MSTTGALLLSEPSPSPRSTLKKEKEEKNDSKSTFHSGVDWCVFYPRLQTRAKSVLISHLNASFLHVPPWALIYLFLFAFAGRERWGLLACFLCSLLCLLFLENNLGQLELNGTMKKKTFGSIFTRRRAFRATVLWYGAFQLWQFSRNNSVNVTKLPVD